MAEITKSVLDAHPGYEANIGIEVHVQLTTKSKVFCTCSNEVTTQPNKNICEICTGQPGCLPVLNKKVVDYALLLGLATDSSITRHTGFARKHYFYPDLPKGYQITQGDDPICKEGFVQIRKEDGSVKKIRLIRIHMEEDAGKSIHAGNNVSLIDYNRAGTPLLEIVSYPDIASAYEAREYLKMIRQIVLYLQICTGNMEEGAFRADTNISVRKRGSDKLGTKVELKNINSFKFIADAIEYEIERQIKAVESGERIRQETRLWDTKDKKTVVMRSKEEAADYRYFREPDLPLITIDDAWIEQMRKTMPELPHQKFERLMQEKGLSAYEAGIIIEDRELADYVEEAMKHSASKNLINWILRDLLGYLKEHRQTPAMCKVTPVFIAALVDMLDQNKINNLAAKEVFEEVAKTGKEPCSVVKEKGLEQIESTQELETIIKQIFDANPQMVAEYKAGKQKLFGFFVGQAMEKTKGRGNPKLIQELLKKLLQ
jgi:aspartyl-tRNA(Asn)/glutamyl-tRNA(Gln) amidotransferase subunit B